MHRRKYDGKSLLTISYNNRSPFKEYMEVMKTQFSLGKNKTDTSKRLRLINFRNEMGEKIVSSQSENDFDEYSSYVTVVVRNRRRNLLRESGGGGDGIFHRTVLSQDGTTTS